MPSETDPILFKYITDGFEIHELKDNVEILKQRLQDFEDTYQCPKLTGIMKLCIKEIKKGKLPVYKGHIHPYYLIYKKQQHLMLFRNFMFDDYKGKCAICGKDIANITEMDIDHIIPKSKGGKDIWANLQATHYFCNRSKHDKLTVGVFF